jgi:hypothetical protein
VAGRRVPAKRPLCRPAALRSAHGAPAHAAGGTRDRGARPAARRTTARRRAGGGAPPRLAAGRPDRRRGAERRPGLPDQAGAPATTRQSSTGFSMSGPWWSTRGWSGRGRTSRSSARTWPTGRDDILAHLRAEGPTTARDLPGHLRGAVALQRLEQRPQRAADARPHGAPWRCRRARAVSGCGTSPTDPSRRQGRPGAGGGSRRAPPEGPRHRAEQGPLLRRGSGRRPGEPAVIEGVRGSWRVDPQQLGQPFRGQTALVSPPDRLVVDRRRMAEIFEFDYQLQMYKPAGQRRWATGRCPSFTATGWWGSSTPPATSPPAPYGSMSYTRTSPSPPPCGPPSTGRFAISPADWTSKRLGDENRATCGAFVHDSSGRP